jgi:hypothetical protein
VSTVPQRREDLEAPDEASVLDAYSRTVTQVADITTPAVGAAPPDRAAATDREAAHRASSSRPTVWC